VARADSPPVPVDEVPFACRPDLVLVGTPATAAVLAAWSEAVDPWQVTVTRGEPLAAAMRPVADRIAGRSGGLVLAGGGARALTHVGVLLELEQAGVAVDRVAGASIGAVMAALHASGRDGAELDAVAYAELVRRRPFGDYGVPLTSLAKGRRMRQAFDRAFGDVLIEGLPRQFACVSTDLVTRTRHVHRRGRLADAALASASLPVLLPPQRHGTRVLVDGGVLDNLPVDLLTERDEGPVVAVNIPMGGGARQEGSRAPSTRIPSLGETLLRTMMIGSGGAVAAARAAGAHVLTPAPRGVGLLEFHQYDRMVESGRAAARALLEATGGDLALAAIEVPSPRSAQTRPEKVSQESLLPAR
jgi:predicted acylesterase/phospholipase RssA